MGFKKTGNRERIGCCPSRQNGRRAEAVRAVAETVLEFCERRQSRISGRIGRRREREALYSLITNCCQFLYSRCRIELSRDFEKTFNRCIAPCSRWHLFELARPRSTLLCRSAAHHVP